MYVRIATTSHYAGFSLKFIRLKWNNWFRLIIPISKTKAILVDKRRTL